MHIARTTQATHVLLRVVAGLLLLQHGGQKLFGWFGGMGGTEGGSVQLMSQMGVAGVLEFFGGAAILLGLFTRPVAFLLSGELAIAYFLAHQSHGAWPIQNHGESAVLYSFIFLFIAAHGAGGFSLDAMRHRKRLQIVWGDRPGTRPWTRELTWKDEPPGTASPVAR